MTKRGPEHAGYTRWALYHQFKDKQDLTPAAFEWILAAWQQEVGVLVEKEPDPVIALLTLARGHAVFCRRDFARVAVALRVEFSGQDHPVGAAVEQAYEQLLAICVRLITSGRNVRAIPRRTTR